MPLHRWVVAQSLRPHASSALWASIQALMEQRLRMLAFSVFMANHQKWAVMLRATVSVSALQGFMGNLELALLATWANEQIHQVPSQTLSPAASNSSVFHCLAHST